MPHFYAKNESGVILDTRTTANLARFQWLKPHNEPLANRGFQAASTYPGHATFKFGDDRTGEVCHAADTAVGVAGIKGMFTAFVLDSDVPALLCKGALETLLGCLDFARQTLTMGANGKVIPLQMSEVGHYVLSVADFPRPAFSASLFYWAPSHRETRLRDLMRNGGFRWDDESQVKSRSAPATFTHPQLFSAC